MRVFFIPNRRDGCFYVRCLLPMMYNGWPGEIESIRGEKRDSSVSVKMAMMSDVVVFQRPDDERKLEAARLLKSAGKKIVFDNDDTYKLDDEDVKLSVVLKKKIKILDEFIRLSDLITTTTDFLADEYRKLNDNVVVLPNCVDKSDWPERLNLKSDDKRVRIGLVGSVTANKDMLVIEKTLKELNKDPHIQLVMFGLPVKDKNNPLVNKLYKKEYKFWSQFNVEWQPFTDIADYFKTLNRLNLDMMLIPRADDYFNRCKSNIKFLEASMLEIPVIAQGFEDGLSPYQINPYDKIRMRIVTNNKWLDEIYALVKDEDLRKTIGTMAKSYVVDKYCIMNNYHKWKDVYNSLLK